MAKKLHHPAARHALAESYRLASLEHLTRLNRCQADGVDPAMTIYLAGLAVECMLRAYRSRIDPEFDARHDLRALARQAQFAAVVPPGDMALVYGERIGRLAQVWSSNDRFVPSNVVTARLRQIGFRPKGNTLAVVAGMIYEDAQWLFSIGRERQ